MILMPLESLDIQCDLLHENIIVRYVEDTNNESPFSESRLEILAMIPTRAKSSCPVTLKAIQSVLYLSPSLKSVVRHI